MNQIEFAQFHADLKAAIVAKVPIQLGAEPRRPASASFKGKVSRNAHRRTSLSRLDGWYDELAPHLMIRESESLLTKINSLDRSQLNLPPRYLAALTTYAAAGSMLPVLDGLTVQVVAERRIKRVLRWPMTYLFLVLLVALLGLTLFTYHVNPTIIDLRADLLLPSAIRTRPHFDATPYLPAVLIALAVGLTIFAIAMVCGGFRKLTVMLGGRKYVQSRTAISMLRTLQLLVVAGLPVTQAVEASIALTGADIGTGNELRAVATRFVNERHWSAVADYRSSSAAQHLHRLQTVLPIVLLSTIGGTVSLLYALAIYGPIVSLIKDLTTAGT